MSLAPSSSSTQAAAGLGLRQRASVQAKSTIHDEHQQQQQDASASDSSSDESGDGMSTFTPPAFTIKDLLGESVEHFLCVVAALSLFSSGTGHWVFACHEKK